MKTLLSTSLLLLSFSVFAQQRQDTTKRLSEVQIRPYFSTQSLLRATGSVGLISPPILEKQPGGSFVSVMNTLSGLRMEERSPGSYRLSIRGSLLRSPFGVRNVKIYFDDFPLTDAGGNSYLNALELAGTHQIQVLKGPQGSIYGANSGGVVLIQAQENTVDSTAVSLKLEGGAYGTFRQNLSLGQQFKKYSLNITQSYQRSDGYRDHSGMDRKYVQALQKYEYAKDRSLKALLFYSDLHYNTPGGLTESQYNERPKGSRPAAGALKSAIEQKAGIYSKTLFGGISHHWQVNNRLKHVVSLFSSYTDFKNPFITNYEKRKEFTLGLRTYLEYQKETEQLNYKFNLGLESMQTASDIDNYGNNQGNPTALKAADKLKASSNVAFAQLTIDLHQKWLFELSASANFYQYTYKSSFPVLTDKKTNHFDTQFMPRMAFSYLIDRNLSLRSAISKGYSPPTISEVRASDNLINTNLQPEAGWNYETGIRYQDQRIQIDLTAFYYRLQSAIVRRLNSDNNEYFINAGGTKQLGLESSISFWLIPTNASRFIRGLELRNAYTLSHFKFSHYSDKTADYSGNSLTGVPKNMLISSADLQFAGNWYLFAQHNYTSSLPLNDANTAHAKKYHLIQAKLGWKWNPAGQTSFPISLFIGADNLLNEKYSLGNDLNAANDRFYNAAATRNFYAGLTVQFKK